ncbi:hypothetical protein BX661DRAFT_102110 [Kickxella alabastrina]|uniref:uncharacterized protein n=1 Tax=Kickxella alabastrina TaxID=61397 RepID=UPI00221F843C|nr:uncharacterized protein BX661DRAFT_102110 [Kickxella alabastrina]KAI7829260.1 hypothetical protein BX661DRAFT_102110 [Kickxella alabastrina]
MSLTGVSRGELQRSSGVKNTSLIIFCLKLGAARPRSSSSGRAASTHEGGVSCWPGTGRGAANKLLLTLLLSMNTLLLGALTELYPLLSLMLLPAPTAMLGMLFIVCISGRLALGAVKCVLAGAEPLMLMPLVWLLLLFPILMLMLPLLLLLLAVMMADAVRAAVAAIADDAVAVIAAEAAYAKADAATVAAEVLLISVNAAGVGSDADTGVGGYEENTLSSDANGDDVALGLSLW